MSYRFKRDYRFLFNFSMQILENRKQIRFLFLYFKKNQHGETNWLHRQTDAESLNA